MSLFSGGEGYYFGGEGHNFFPSCLGEGHNFLKVFIPCCSGDWFSLLTYFVPSVKEKMSRRQKQIKTICMNLDVRYCNEKEGQTDSTVTYDVFITCDHSINLLNTTINLSYMYIEVHSNFTVFHCFVN